MHTSWFFCSLCSSSWDSIHSFNTSSDFFAVHFFCLIKQSGGGRSFGVLSDGGGGVVMVSYWGGVGGTGSARAHRKTGLQRGLKPASICGLTSKFELWDCFCRWLLGLS